MGKYNNKITTNFAKLKNALNTKFLIKIITNSSKSFFAFGMCVPMQHR